VLLEDDPDADTAPPRVLERLQDDLVADDVGLQVDRVPCGLDFVEERRGRFSSAKSSVSIRRTRERLRLAIGPAQG
jgi:hypothetical protein